jgi:general secretion pathway protein D
MEKAPGSEIYLGSGRFTNAPHAQQHIGQPATAPDITLNFINTDVKDVAKAILGDYLKLNYEIAPNVAGTITIQTSQPISKDEILPVLDRSLRLNNMVLVHANNIYHIVALTDAVHQAGGVIAAGSREAAGFGVEVVTLHYVSVAEMRKLLEPIAPSQAIVQADTSRNVLVIQGTKAERDTLIEDIRLFDADWLQGMSFALYTPHYTDDQELARELSEVIGGLNSPIGGVVRLVPIDRLNAVLAISPQPRYLDQLKSWIARFDKPGEGSKKQIYIYDVQHGRATDLAGTLIAALSTGMSTQKTFQHTSTSAQPEATLPSLAATPMSASPAASAAATPLQPVALEGSEAVSGTANTPLGSISITADVTNNALVIIATPQQYNSLEKALVKLDTAPLQVLLEAAIAEVTLTKDLSFGIQYALRSANGQQTAIFSSSNMGTIAPTFPGFSYTFTGTNIQVILNELSGVTKVEVLSSPSLLVLNNQSATLQVGDQVPVVTAQAISTVTSGAPLVNSVQYENTGVILNVTPRVNRSGEVMMDISQEVSDVTNTTTSDIDSPTIEERKVTSTVAVQDGQTVALGGLITRNTSHGTSGLPFLQEIPVLGSLFGTTTDHADKTELVVLITPHVVDNLQKAQAITAELRRKLPDVAPLLSEP